MNLISGTMNLDTCKAYLEFKTSIKPFKAICVLDKNGLLLHFGKDGIENILANFKKFKFIEFYHKYNEMVIEVA